jgi:hypothetical protein
MTKTISESAIDMNSVGQFTLPEPTSPQANQSVVSFTKLNDAATAEEMEAMKQSKLPRLLESIGLGDIAQKTPMNQMGRFTLMNALASKFGPDFYKQAEAQQVMSTFDQYLQDYKIEAGRSLNDIANKGKRTLEYLLG